MTLRIQLLAPVIALGLALHVTWTLDAQTLPQESPATPTQSTSSDTQDTKNPPVAPARLIAEWEPAIGTMIAWPLSVPDELVIELANSAKLYLLVNKEKLSEAKEKIQALKIDLEKVHFLECSVASNWPRDWGPHQLFRDDGTLQMVNHRFQGYPIYPRLGDEPEFTFRPGKGDDAVCSEVAKALDLSVLDFPAYLTGGNFLVDGEGTAFCTRAQLTENKVDTDEATLRQLLANQLGIDRLIVLENTEPFGIQHIDCWMKVLDSERLLIKRAPEGHPEAAPLERNVKVLSSLRNAFGRKYKILRIDCPEVPVKVDEGDAPAIAAYTNSLILNNKVYVPLFGVEGDKNAIKTWQEALPGYEVKGYVSDDWKHFDALHCRTRAVFDSQLLRLEHPILKGQLAFSDKGHAIEAIIEDMSPEGIDPNRCLVKIRKDGGDWMSIPLVPLHSENRWVTLLPSYPVGSQLEYQLEVHSKSGRNASHPRMAPKIFHRFEIVEPTTGNQ